MPMSALVTVRAGPFAASGLRRSPADPDDGRLERTLAGAVRLRNFNLRRIEPKLREPHSLGRLRRSDAFRLTEGSLADVPDRARSTARDRPCNRRCLPGGA